MSKRLSRRSAARTRAATLTGSQRATLAAQARAAPLNGKQRALINAVRAIPAQRQRRRRRQNASLTKATVYNEPKVGFSGGITVNNSRSDRTFNRDTLHNDSAIVDRFSRRTEKVANITGTTAFTHAFASGLYLNPGNSTLFPVFSRIASQYEQFKCRHLSFHYTTEAYSSIGTTASAGKIIMVTNYDPNEAVFSDDTTAENYCGMDKGPPHAGFSHNVQTKSAGRRGYDPISEWYVNSSANLAAPTADSTQAKWYDIGLFQLMTYNNGSTTNVGELYVTYEFDMIRPKADNTNAQVQIYHAVGTADAATSTAPFSTARTTSPGSTITYTMANSTIGLPTPGNYMIVGIWTDAATITTVPSYTLGSALTGVLTMGNNSLSQLGLFNTAADTAVMVGFISCATAGTGAANLLTMAGLATMTSADMDLFVVRVPLGFTLSKRPTLATDEVSQIRNLLRQYRLREEETKEFRHGVDDARTGSSSSSTSTPFNTPRTQTTTASKPAGWFQ